MSPDDDLGVSANDELFYLIMRLARSFQRACDDIAFREGISVAEVNILLVLGEGVPMSSAQLARRAFITPQASHQLVTRLESGGVVEYQPHATNRRVRLVHLTESGRELLGRVRHDLRVVQDRAMGDLAPREQERLRQDLLGVATRFQGGWFGETEAEEAAAARRAGRTRPTDSTPQE